MGNDSEKYRKVNEGLKEIHKETKTFKKKITKEAIEKEEKERKKKIKYELNIYIYSNNGEEDRTIKNLI